MIQIAGQYRAAYLFFRPFFTAAYIAKGLLVLKIYVLKKEIRQFLGLNSAVYNREQVIIPRERYVVM